MRVRRRHLLLTGVALLVSVPLVTMAVGTVYLGHDPWTIPPAWRVPTSQPAAPGQLSIRYLGVSTYQVSDGATTLLLDAALTRPTLAELVTAPVESDPAVVEQWIDRADFVLVNHAHYDHVLDAPSIARATGATVVGSASVCNYAVSRGLPRARTREVTAGDRLRLGTFDVVVQRTRHSPLMGREGLMQGTMPDDAGDLWFWQMTQDATLIYRLQSAEASLLFHPSSVYTPQPDLEPVDVLIFGISGTALDAAKAARVIEAFSPQWFLPTHYDNFFQPLERGLALLPVSDIVAAHAAVRAVSADIPWYVLDYGETIYFRD